MVFFITKILIFEQFISLLVRELWHSFDVPIIMVIKEY